MPEAQESIPNARPYDLIREHIEELYAEAKNFADGEPIATPGQAEAVQTLMRQIQQAEKAADAERVKENEPFDTGKAEVQSRYASLIGNTKAVKGKTVQAVEALKACLAPWLKKLDDEQKAKAEAARLVAEKAIQDAADAMRQAQGANLADREDAEQKATEAQAAMKAAKDAENARPQASGFGRAATLRTTYKAVLVDAQVAAGAYWKQDPTAFNAFLQKLADADVASGRRSIPGFEVVEERSVV
jgi:hypothetical protein